MSHYDVDAQELLDAGCHFGHQAKRWNPKMKPFIYTERDGVHIFDLVKTGALLEEAMEFVRDTVRAGKEIVFLGAKRQAKAIVLEEAMKVGAPYVTERWLGGMLTNWDEMEKRIKKLNTLKKQRDNNELAGYTKKERVMIDKKIERLTRFFGGIAHLKSRPDAIFVVDTHREKTSVFEAGVVGAKVVGMIDTNADPIGVDFPIPVNDDAVRSIKLVVEKIGQAYADGKAMRAKEQPAAPVVVAAKPVIQPTFIQQPVVSKTPVAPVRAKEVNPAFTKVAEAIKPKKVLKPTSTTKKASSKKKVVVSIKKRK